LRAHRAILRYTLPGTGPVYVYATPVEKVSQNRNDEEEMTVNSIRELRPGDESLLVKFLNPRRASSLFLLGNMRTAGLADTGAPLTGRYLGEFCDGALVGCLAHFWNGNIILQTPDGPEALLTN
jgi:hypothetical protein